MVAGIVGEELGELYADIGKGGSRSGEWRCSIDSCDVAERVVEREVLEEQVSYWRRLS
jgi:hypothetical protein